MAFVNHLTKIGELEAFNRVTIKKPENGIAPINADPTLSVVIYPYIIGSVGRIKIRNVSIDTLKN